jgi:hypothetical protein
MSRSSRPITHRKRLNAALRDLRQLGYIAKGPAPCCPRCCVRDMAETFAGKEFTGDTFEQGMTRVHKDPAFRYVFWHSQQDDAAFQGDKHQTLVDLIHLNHGGHIEPFQVAMVLSWHGFATLWNGDESTTIVVYPMEWGRQKALRLLGADTVERYTTWGWTEDMARGTAEDANPRTPRFTA